MKNLDKNLLIQKDQLWTLQQFIGFCRNRDFFPDETFLRAALKEEFLLPITVDENGLDLFSPHQMILLVLLRDNKVKDGVLEFPEKVATEGSGSNQHYVRAIRWGTYGYFMERDFENLQKWSRLLTDFLVLVHSLPLKKITDNDDVAYWRNSPVILFDFKKIKEDPQMKYISEKKLTVENLKSIRLKIASWCEAYDPLEKWFYFVRRIPRHRREELRGDARLAQEFYDLDCIVQEFLTVSTSESQLDVYSFKDLEGPFSFLSRKSDFIEGIDFISLKKASESLANLRETDAFLGEEDATLLKKVRKDLEEFFKKFGEEWIEPSGIPYERRSSEGLSSENLPPKYKKIHEMDNNWDPVSLIYSWLNDIWRELINIIARLQDKLQQKIREALPKFRDVHGKMEITSEVKQLRSLSEKVSDIYRMANEIYCSDCRENSVPKSERFTNASDLICTGCIKKRREMVLSDLEIKKTMFMRSHDGEWHCPFCKEQKLLYKFANRNVLISQSKNDAFSSITLEYGKIRVEIRCANCGKISEKIFCCGWDK